MASHPDTSRAVTAGVVTALVGFTSSFAVVLAGLHQMGASPAQAASGLLALTVLQGAATMWLSWHHRLPITIAWSTPGAALLASTGAVSGGWPAAVGAFAVTGVLLLASGVWTGLADLVRRIPTPLAQAMLAGVLMPICLQPFTSLAHHPLSIAPVLLCWLAFQRLAPRWAVPAAFAVAALVIGVALARSGTPIPASQLLPRLVFSRPHLGWQAVVGVALPLYVVTMASQNIAGVAVLKSFGFDVPWRSSLAVTGLGTVLGALCGGHAINLAAISAALAAGPEAGERPERRWRAAFAAGVSYLVLGVASAAMATLILLAPAGVAATVAGLALLPTLSASLHGALDERGHDPAFAGHERIAAVVTFLVAASGLALGGVGSAFWALLAGLLVRAWLVGRTAHPNPHPSTNPGTNPTTAGRV